MTSNICIKCQQQIEQPIEQAIEQPVVEQPVEKKRRGRPVVLFTAEDKKIRKSEYNKRYYEKVKNSRIKST